MAYDWDNRYDSEPVPLEPVDYAAYMDRELRRVANAIEEIISRIDDLDDRVSALE